MHDVRSEIYIYIYTSKRYSVGLAESAARGIVNDNTPVKLVNATALGLAYPAARSYNTL